jgi:hypothetical protein
VPDDAHAGEVHLMLGIYVPPVGPRLPVSGAEGVERALRLPLALTIR